MSENESGAAKKLKPRVVLGILALQAAIFTAIGLMLWRFSGRPLGEFIRADAGDLAFGCLLGLGFIALALGIFRGFPKLAEKMIRSQGETYSFLENRFGFGAIIVVSICAGVGEETLFRGGIQTLAADYMGTPLAIALSSALFALMHLSKPVIGLILFAIGMVFGLVYWLSGSLLLVIVAHALYDVFALWYLQRELHRIGFFGQPDTTTTLSPG